jgi:diguanylate cyclase (GGDEF)-like protein
MMRNTAMPGMRWRDFEWRTFGIAALLAASVLLSIVVIPQWLSRQARWEVLRSHVGQVARLAASTIDGDLHRQLLDQSSYSDAVYQQALAPLVRFHSATPGLYYVYTMMERDGEAYFVLDTAQSKQLKTPRKLQASAYMEHFVLKPEYASDWLQQIAAGTTWVTPVFQRDDYGYFLSGHAPIHDSQGRYSGFVGVDFDSDYYRAQEQRFKWIGLGSMLAALLISVLLAYLAARYHYEWQHRLALHYHSSMRDELTQLLNRRGAYEAVEVLRAIRSTSHAVLLIDIDNFKRINDSHGHVVGDEVLVSVAKVIRDSVRDRDVVARLGGDEFLVFAPDCDERAAREIVVRILNNAAAQTHVPYAYTLSVGICIESNTVTEFDVMYRRADEAMYRAKAAGKNRYEVVGVYDPPFLAHVNIVKGDESETRYYAARRITPPTQQRQQADHAANPPASTGCAAWDDC